MTVYETDLDTSIKETPLFYDEQINRIIDVVTPQFERVVRNFLLFNLTFGGLIIAEIFLLLTFFNAIVDASLVALTLGAIFLTFFSFLILRVYLLNHKSFEIKKIEERFLRGCRELMQYTPGEPEHHIALANACTRFADRLGRKEFRQRYSKGWLSFLNPYTQKLKWWLQWEDYQRLKELLLTEAVNENIELVKVEPISLDVHASLANAYVMLSGLYVDPRVIDGNEDEPWVPEAQKDLMQKKFRETAQKAVEEFKIISSFAPDDPWVHTQLAYSYHDLQMLEEEINQYEIIHKLVPHDDDCLYKLGALYFQQGLNAQGLEIYAKLCHSNMQKAKSLISHYGG